MVTISSYSERFPDSFDDNCHLFLGVFFRVLIPAYGVATPHSQSTEFKERHEVNGCSLCGAGMLGRGVRLIYIEGEPCDDCGVENDYDYFHLDDVVWC